MVRDNSNLRVALDIQEPADVEANRTISRLEEALNTARANTERLTSDYNNRVARFQRENSDLQTALDVRERTVIDANQTISDLRSALDTAHEDSERLRVGKLPFSVRRF